MNSFVGILVIGHLLAAPAAEGVSDLAPQAGVVVLKNGHTLAGEITRAGDYVVVTLGPKSDLRLPATEVDFTCRDLEEAYAHKVRLLPPDKVTPHLDLAEWCLRQNLTPQAAEQVIAAMKLDAKHPRLPGLEQRLKLAAERPTQQETRGALPTLGADDLDKFTRELPKTTVERFAATIQPILLNRCANNGCHGPSSTSDFKLLRPAAGQVANRRFTQRNLYATWQFVDRSNPTNSPLLTKPQDRHGTATGPIFDKQSQIQLEQLAYWIRLATAKPDLAQPASITAAAEQLSQPARSTPAPKLGSDETKEPSAANEEPARSPTDSSKPKPAATTTHNFSPRDPSDPEQFNRMYHPQP